MRAMLKWQVVLLDGPKLLQRASLHDEVRLKFLLPEWYGRNMDALLDVLSTLDDRKANLSRSVLLGRGENCVLRIAGSEVMLKEAAELFVEFAGVVAAANLRFSESASETRLLLELG
jgi:RNAse (barnase) inhibitor barstar